MDHRQLEIRGVIAAHERAADPGTDHGEVFTRPWMVDFILDLVGYAADRDLAASTLIEPSCGTGAFLARIIARLIESATSHGRPLAALGDAIRAYDLLESNASVARKAASLQLQEAGLDVDDADRLAAGWVGTGDFLLDHDPQIRADFVVGNPPYVRLESVPVDRMRRYRVRCPTMRGRADIYIGFIEVGLSLLAPDGVLGFICADRWMRNQYGGGLRELVSSQFAVDAVVTLHDVDAFEDAVAAYPAVAVIRNGVQGPATVVDAESGFDRSAAADVVAWAESTATSQTSAGSFSASRLPRWFPGRDLWPSAPPAQLALIADLEARFPPLEDPLTGTRVGIGVATGCDEVFITRDPQLVESDRLMPLLKSGDTGTGTIDWSGTFLVSPWDEQGLVDLDDYPQLHAHLHAHEDRLRARHVGRKYPDRWYRTIDRVDGALRVRTKLVLPDIKAAAHPVIDLGTYYPHHNLYHVTSDGWDLEVLGGLLLSDVANLFVGAYCVKMRGGCFRFQAQYLRRIRVPRLDSISPAAGAALAGAFGDRDKERANGVAAQLYSVEAATFAREQPASRSAGFVNS